MNTNNLLNPSFIQHLRRVLK